MNKNLDTTILSDLFATDSNALAELVGGISDLVGALGLELVEVSFE